jgi:DHA3 family macrolide efflux protein-like MFS transporter
MKNEIFFLHLKYEVIQFISMLTSYAVHFAIIIWLSLEHRSAGVLAVAGISAILPQAIIGSFAGVFIDRWNRKKVLILSDAFLALCALIMVIPLRNDAVNLNWIYLMLGLRSVGNAFHSPAMHAIAPLLVPQQELLRVSGINQLLHSLSGIIGPAIGTGQFYAHNIRSFLYPEWAAAIRMVYRICGFHTFWRYCDFHIFSIVHYDYTRRN